MQALPATHALPTMHAPSRKALEECPGRLGAVDVAVHHAMNVDRSGPCGREAAARCQPERDSVQDGSCHFGDDRSIIGGI